MWNERNMLVFLPSQHNLSDSEREAGQQYHQGEHCFLEKAVKMQRKRFLTFFKQIIPILIFQTDIKLSNLSSLVDMQASINFYPSIITQTNKTIHLISS